MEQRARLAARRRQGREDYGARLARDLGVTPVYVRYNSGRHISENGRSLAELLEAVVARGRSRSRRSRSSATRWAGSSRAAPATWPRSRTPAWVRHVRKVVSLGSPHMGAPLEQAVHYASLRRSAGCPRRACLGTFLRRRSAGIRDLRQGSLVDDDWRDRDPEALRAAACEEVPLLEGATHCFVSATVTRSPRHPLGRMRRRHARAGAERVRAQSRTRKLGFEDEYGLHVGATHHIALLNHPAVYEKLRAWLR